MPRPCGSQWIGTCRELTGANVADKRVHMDKEHGTVQETKSLLTEASDGQHRAPKLYSRHSRFSAGVICW